MTQTSPRLLRFTTTLLVLTLASVTVHAQESFRALRTQHHTKLLYAPETPPAGTFDLIKYKSPIGEMSAYVSPDPKDGKKHPIILWLVGGFSNSIGPELWATADPANDQSAAAYRKAGLLMMFPSLRGGNDNPGKVEVCCGEVDDVIAAAKHAATLPYVDPTRIYLGGHSTGGTLALVVAASTDLFRAVIAFGPAHTVAVYGAKNLPFDPTNKQELLVRAPIVGLAEITCPTIVLEGAEGGNTEALQKLKQFNKNPKVHLYEVPRASHFTILSPFNALLAKKLLADTAPTSHLDLTPEEIEATARDIKPDKKR